MLRIKLVKSTIGHNPRNRATVKALGLTKPHSVVEQEDTPTIRGMIRHVHPLLSVEVIQEVPGTEAKAKVLKAVKPKAVELAAAVVVEPVKTEETTEAKPKAKRTKKAAEETSEETK